MSVETPFGKVPLLEVDGKLMHQSLAIERYLGRLAGLTGADAWEDAQIDIMADTITDFRVRKFNTNYHFWHMVMIIMVKEHRL